MNQPDRSTLAFVNQLTSLKPEQIQALHRYGIFFVGNLVHLGEQFPDRIAELLNLSASVLSTVIEEAHQIAIADAQAITPIEIPEFGLSVLSLPTSG